MFARFLRDRSANVGMIFGLSALPLLGFAAAAVDYSRATNYKSFMHRETDSAALSIASADTPNADAVINDLQTRLLTKYGTAGSSTNPVKSVSVTGNWTGSAIYNMVVTASLSNTLLTAIPNMPSTLAISVTTAVSRIPAQWRWSLPTIRDLSYEAADYNRISVYCYDDRKKTDANKGRRLETLTAIADNGGTIFTGVALPTCLDGETLSYQLRNVRNSRTSPGNWNNAYAEHYLYFTDTVADPNTRVLKNVVTGGREYPDGSMSMIDLTSAPLVETILCNSTAECQPQSSGGILPNNHQTDRTPATATGGCMEGKSMYYGWEDRPPTSPGASDRDYDDIRIVVSCPTLTKITDKQVKIFR